MTPFAFEVNPTDNNIYVANRGSNEVSIIDPSSNSVIETLEVGEYLMDLELNPNDGYLYVATYFSNAVSVIDISSNKVVGSVEVGNHRYSVQLNPINSRIYVAVSGSDIVSIIDSDTNTVVDTVEVGNTPLAIEDNPANYNMYVTNFNSEDVSVIDTGLSSLLSPVADAGPDQTVDSNELVQLEGSNSSDPNDSSLSYSWTQTEGPEVTISDPTSVNPTFISPEVDEETLISLNLTVTNELELTDSDSVTITVQPITTPPKPIAKAGPDQSVNSNDLVQLDGSNSSDPNDSPLTYSWAQISGPEVTLSDSTSPNPTFVAPETNEQTDLAFQLTVTNEEGITSEPDEVVITVKPTTAPPPPNEEPKTIGDLIKGIIQNPLDITNSIDSANEIRDILTDNNRDNDKLACDLLDSQDRYSDSIREILNC